MIGLIINIAGTLINFILFIQGLMNLSVFTGIQCFPSKFAWTFLRNSVCIYERNAQGRKYEECGYCFSDGTSFIYMGDFTAFSSKLISWDCFFLLKFLFVLNNNENIPSGIPSGEGTTYANLVTTSQR